MDSQLPILRALEASDPEVAGRISTQVVSRRSALKAGAGASASLGMALRIGSAPVALAAFASEAFGQTRLPAVVVNVLNYALVLEELESRFYIAGVAAGVVPAADLTIFTTIRDHEIAHVAFLRNALGAQARPSPMFDFTAKGAYADVFSNYNTFKAVSQALEDTGVRAYKGQAPALRPYKDILTAALTIHSVEARHAAEIRRLRGNFEEREPFFEGWITEAQTDVPGAAGNYAGEDNTVHAGVDATTLSYTPAVTRKEVTEAFDEPLTQSQVIALITPFFA